MRRSSHIFTLLLAFATVQWTLQAQAQPPAENLPQAAVDPDPYQLQRYWTDRFVQHDWRIQRNVATGNFRLLDDRDQVRLEGDFDACRECFDTLRQESQLLPVKGKVVLLLHGLFRSYHAGVPLQRELQQHGYTVLRIGYASTQNGIAEHAEALQQVISFLPEATEIHFVGHSMGNIVIRKYLSDSLQEGEGRLDPRIKRFVMLGPPNQGSAVASKFGDSAFVNSVAGAGVLQLGGKWQEFVQSLTMPPIEFGIIAGNTAEGSQGNPLIPGPDDLVVAVEETRLAGARDFEVLPVMHMRMFADRTVQQRVLTFLDHGYFNSADERQPIEQPAAAVSTEQADAE